MTLDFFFLSEWGPPGAEETAGGDGTFQPAHGCVMDIQPPVTEPQSGLVWIDRPLGSFRSEPSDGQSASLPWLCDEPGPALWLLGGGALGSATHSLLQGSEFSFRRRQGCSFSGTQNCLPPLLPAYPVSQPHLQTLVLVSWCFSPGPETQPTGNWFFLIAVFGLSSEFLRMLSPRICSVPFIVLCALQGV